MLPLMQALYREDGTAPLDVPAARRALDELLARRELGCVWLAVAAQDPPCARPAGLERTVGYVVLTLGFSLEWHGRDAFIDELYVAPERRGCGIGRALLAVAEGEARRAGVRALHLEVEPGNRRARAVYERAGYADNGRRLATKRL
ncbi:MAG TPA: GNAT family N-acetyltransferase [Gemmatimonadota bacterium]